MGNYVLPTPCSKNLSSAPCSETQQSQCPSITVRDQDSNPYKITGKTVILRVLIPRCVFKERMECKASELNGSKHLPN
jgi:hypothetical protein